MHKSCADDPFTSSGHMVKPEWLDSYEHMNMARYVELFDSVAYQLLDRVDLGAAYTLRTRQGVFVVDARVRFLKELPLGTTLSVSLRLLGVDDLRLHMWLELRQTGGDAVCATQEQLVLHVDLNSRKTKPFSIETRQRLEEVVQTHRREPAHREREIGMSCKVKRAK